MAKNYSMTILAIVAVVALAVGYIAAQSMSAAPLSQANAQFASAQTQVNTLHSQVTDLQTQVNTLQSQITDLQSQVQQAHLEVGGKADVFEAKMHDLLQEHTFLLINTVRRSLDGSASFNASYNALQVNINDAGNTLSQIYRQSDVSQFVQLWNQKVSMFINYTNAVKNNDSTANSVFASNAAAYEEAVANYWSNTSTPVVNLDKATVKGYVTVNVNNVKAAVDYWGAADYPNYFAKLHDSYIQAGIWTDYLVVGIIQQHPEKFL